MLLDKFKWREFLGHRSNCYKQTFTSPEGQEVLKDLAQFCRATESTFHADARMHAVMEGRREVFLRIQKNLSFSLDDLFKEFSGGMRFDPRKEIE